MIGFAWCPKRDMRAFDAVMDKLRRNSNIKTPHVNQVERHHINPPSVFRTNEFTYAFQEIVNTYGIPGYKEVNPAIFTIVTFPFLFGIMFGDLGHGSILAIVGMLMCFSKDRLVKKNPAMKDFLSARYLILMMGLFGAYCGFVYNDFMSIPIFHSWGSCYHLRGPEKGKVINDDCVYPIGIDPVWYMSSNNLAFQNSFKMKLSVILGVLQMSLGICMKGFNAVYFGSKLDFFCEFVPQIILLLVLFGYMDALIVIKWLTDYSGKESRAPGIINTMIGMFLSGGAVPPSDDALVGSPETQQSLAVTFLLIALICIPWMLLPKPFILARRQEKEDLAAEEAKNTELEEKPVFNNVS